MFKSLKNKLDNIKKKKITKERIKLEDEKKRIDELKEEINKEEIKEEPSSEEPKKEGLINKINEINEKIDIFIPKAKEEKKLKKKSFKLPFQVKSQLKKLAVKNKAMALVLQGNRNATPTIARIETGMLLVGDNIYDGNVEGTWLWQGKHPFYIIPEWDLKPISKEGINRMRQPLGSTELYKDTIDNNRSSEPQKIILRAMEAKENLMLKHKVSPKAIIIAIIITLIVAGVLFGGGGI